MKRASPSQDATPALKRRYVVDWEQPVSQWERSVLDPRTSLVNNVRILERCSTHLREIIDLVNRNGDGQGPILDHAMCCMTGVETCHDSLRIILQDLCGDDVLRLIDSTLQDGPRDSLSYSRLAQTQTPSSEAGSAETDACADAEAKQGAEPVSKTATPSQTPSPLEQEALSPILSQAFSPPLSQAL